MAANPKHLDPAELKQGDVVRLWSDGPEMTVLGQCAETRGWLACCWWSEGDRKYMTANFPPATLELVPRD